MKKCIFFLVLYFVCFLGAIPLISLQIELFITGKAEQIF